MGGSALTDTRLNVPHQPSEGIPITYVPARNTIFLSVALGWAEVLNARDIYIGVNAVDYAGYPDCRPEFIQAFQNLANLGTRAGVEGDGFRVHAPLINLSKAEIIATGVRLGVDYALTLSCYEPDAAGQACGTCDSCRLRAQGFVAAGHSRSHALCQWPPVPAAEDGRPSSGESWCRWNKLGINPDTGFAGVKISAAF